MRRFIVGIVAVAVLGTASAALASGGLSGKYKAKLSGAPASTGANGTWLLDFTRGHYKVTHNGGKYWYGKDQITGSKITFPAGPSCEHTGKYKFKLTGKKLKFTLISDSCQARPRILALTFKKTT